VSQSAADDAAASCREQLLWEFQLYDRAADIVAIFEYIFTRTENVPRHVDHFERFPRVGPTSLTPEFSVVTATRRGIVGEVARFGRHDNSVDELCVQLEKYGRLTELPGPDSKPVAISHVDVLLVVDIELGIPAVRRIIRERMLNDGHVYNPPVAPVIVQVTQDARSSKYVFQRIRDPDNGDLRDGDWPEDVQLSRWLEENALAVPPNLFIDTKAERPLINDRAPAIYLAILLWSLVFPELALSGEESAELTITPNALAAHVRERYGRARVGEINDALALLREAGLAARPGGGPAWRIRYRPLRVPLGSQLVEEIVRRVCAARTAKVSTRQMTLPETE
jgi:hypothetical protein